MNPEPTRRTGPTTISIGGATYDLFVKLCKTAETGALSGGKLELPVGGKVQINSVVESCGGGANNTAIGLARLGCNARFCGITGEDQWGKRLLENLEHEGVDVSPATIIEEETSSFSLILSLQSGERTILYSSGVNRHLHDATFDRDALKHADAVYLNRLSETASVIEDDIIAMLESRRNLHLTWNPGGSQLEAGMTAKNKPGLIRCTGLMLLNKEEALKFTHTDSVSDALGTLTVAGARNVCITDGANGTWASDGHHRFFCPSIKGTEVVDSTGAGDAFGVGATWALITGKSLPTAMIAGTLNAVSVIGFVGAQAGLLTETQMRSRLSRHLLAVELMQ